MFDFLYIASKLPKQGVVVFYPKFVIKKSGDLMIRGGDFYAVWDEERGFWSTDEQDAIRLIDKELDIFVDEHKKAFDGQEIRVLHMWDADSGIIDKWHKYCQRQMRDNFHPLDERVIFSNDVVKKDDYATRQLSYPLEKGTCPAYDKLVSVLYSPEERQKIEWAIGSVITGDSRTVQKFVTLYGAMGTGKSTILNLISKLFDGYCATFSADALGNPNDAFALEAFKQDPLVAIQHDGNLSKITDNTRLNSLISHETMMVNEKHKSLYSRQFKTFLFIGTNNPVKITDAKSGLIRRLIDIQPTGEKIPYQEYAQLIKQMDFELGAIAWHCRDIYLKHKDAYENYIPLAMLESTNDFYNFMWDGYLQFKEEDGTTVKSAWAMYKTYCEEAKVLYPFSLRVFTEELKAYFREYYKERYTLEDGTRVRNYCKGFRTEKFIQSKTRTEKDISKPETWLIFNCTTSLLDNMLRDCPAQYANEYEKPQMKWDDISTTLADLNTHKLHYVRVPITHIVIDFDIPGEDGQKDFEKNLEAASKWPPTYAELSKSGAGIHLHYIYTGKDPLELERLYAPHIEIKVFSGKLPLRRKVTKCNDIPVASISSGLPMKGESKVINEFVVKNEKAIRTMIKKNLAKEYHPDTTSSVDYIYKILTAANNAGIVYDVSDLYTSVLAFAAGATNQSERCIKTVGQMPFKSDNETNPEKDISDNDSEKIVFFDLEVFPNLFVVNWKVEGEGKTVIRMINPSAAQIEDFLDQKFRLVGFNNRRYDNHILYARLMGYTNEQLYKLSQKIISNEKKKGLNDGFFREAYNISYTDIYDFASAGNKKSLKKLEIEMDFHHKELGLPWDQPVPEDRWIEVAEYCDNDVLATEAAFHYLVSDWTARQILADLAGMTVNDTTNTLTTKIIFGDNRHPQDQFNYRDMGGLPTDEGEIFSYFNKDGFPMWYEYPESLPFKKRDYEYAAFVERDEKELCIFPGYKYENGTSTYRGEKVGEGGYVYAEPGIYHNVALLDIASMHPSSIVAEELFGLVYTKRFKDILDARIAIKHEDWAALEMMLDGKLKPYIQKVKSGELTSKDLANALKTAINSVYGLTKAGFDNPFRDIRNMDNIVAKRGALFMVNLKHEVQNLGYTVAHIKTDSIKIPNATPDIIQFVMEYGKLYGYTFEHEATYERMCLVNDAVYIARYLEAETCKRLYNGFVPGDNAKKGGKWTATGTQFQVPYVFKTLFSHEPIVLDDLCETKSCSTALYLNMNENCPDVSWYEDYVKEIDKEHSLGQKADEEWKEERRVMLEHIDQGHNYHFIGRVGQFCPIKTGCGGGLLMRKNGTTDGYSAVGGTKGYRWLESELVRSLEREKDIDISYYELLAKKARLAIEKYGKFEDFVGE